MFSSEDGEGQYTFLLGESESSKSERPLQVVYEPGVTYKSASNTQVTLNVVSTLMFSAFDINAAMN